MQGASHEAVHDYYCMDFRRTNRNITYTLSTGFIMNIINRIPTPIAILIIIGCLLAVGTMDYNDQINDSAIAGEGK